MSNQNQNGTVGNVKYYCSEYVRNQAVSHPSAEPKYIRDKVLMAAMHRPNSLVAAQVSHYGVTLKTLNEKLQGHLDALGIEDPIDRIITRQDIYETWYRKYANPGESRDDFIARCTGKGTGGSIHSMVANHPNVLPPINSSNSSTPVGQSSTEVPEEARNGGSECECGLHKVSPGAKAGHSSWCPANKGEL